MIAWAIRQGIESGLLDESEFAPPLNAGIRGILRFTDEEGQVGQSMADAAGIGRYPWLFGHTTWTQGFALLAAGHRAP
jgi:rhamnogalacturonyl hydrolase YesR